MADNKAIKEFIAETEELTENIEKKLFELSDVVASKQESPDTVNSIFRDFHSLKGISGMFGFMNLSKLAHQLENFLDRIRLGKLELNQNVIDALLNGKELLTEILKAISSEGKDDVPVDDFIANLERSVTTQAPARTAETADSGALAQLKKVLTEYEEHRLLDNMKKGRKIFSLKFSFSIEEFDERLNEITALLKKTGEVISTLPKPSDKPGSIIFSIIFATETEESAWGIKDSYGCEVSRLTESEPGRALEEKETAVPVEQTGQIKSISNTIRVDISKLDYLMNIVGELVTQKSLIAELIERTKKQLPNDDLVMALSKGALVLGKKINELQESVMTIRMVHLDQLFDKLERNLKKIAHEIKKDVKINIKGGETELDKYIVEELTDPLMHIIRNSIDHGIENAEVRIAAGKPEYGTIELLAYQKGNHVFIEIRDDGHGIDTDKIREKLIAMGKISPEQETSQEFLMQAIFLPGFSIKEVATELSGRGVGLDVVKSNLLRLRGTVEVKTEKGKGTSFVLTLPLTLLIIQAIIMRSSAKTFAIPVSSVDEIVEISKDSIVKISGEDVINLRNVPLPIFYLERFFEYGDMPEKFRFLVVIKTGEKKAGIIIDDIIGQGDIVIKSMGRYINVKGIAGATQIGEGETILVLDTASMIEEFVKV